MEDLKTDAELVLRSLYRHHLANDVHIATDGKEALDFLSSSAATSIGLVLLDLCLPKVGGLEVLARIRSDPALATLRVIVLTESEESASIAEARRRGANSYIVKPIDFVKMVEIARVLGLHWQLLDPRLSASNASHCA